MLTLKQKRLGKKKTFLQLQYFFLAADIEIINLKMLKREGEDSEKNNYLNIWLALSILATG